MRCWAFKVDVVGCTNTRCWSQRRQGRNSCCSIANSKTKANAVTHKQFEVLTSAARTGVASADFLHLFGLPMNLPVKWFLALHREFSRGAATGGCNVTLASEMHVANASDARKVDPLQLSSDFSLRDVPQAGVKRPQQEPRFDMESLHKLKKAFC